MRAGFVLAGGASSRMGRDKALLPASRGESWIERIASRVEQAAGTATIIGPPERYRALRWPVTADKVEGRGPLGGLLTALAITPAEWNLVAACDMPYLTSAILRTMIEIAEDCRECALVPVTSRGPQPLCAVYHRNLLPEVQAAIGEKALRMVEFVSAIGARFWPVPDESEFLNINTPEELIQGPQTRP